MCLFRWHLVFFCCFASFISSIWLFTVFVLVFLHTYRRPHKNRRPINGFICSIIQLIAHWKDINWLDACSLHHTVSMVGFYWFVYWWIFLLICRSKLLLLLFSPLTAITAPLLFLAATAMRWISSATDSDMWCMCCTIFIGNSRHECHSCAWLSLHVYAF